MLWKCSFRFTSILCIFDNLVWFLVLSRRNINFIIFMTMQMVSFPFYIFGNEAPLLLSESISCAC